MQNNIWHINCTSGLTASPVKVNFFSLRIESGENSDLEGRKPRDFFPRSDFWPTAQPCKILWVCTLYCRKINMCAQSKISTPAGNARVPDIDLIFDPLWMRRARDRSKNKAMLVHSPHQDMLEERICFWQMSWGKGWGKKVGTVPYICVQGVWVALACPCILIQIHRELSKQLAQKGK